jgi:hypothetical protein
MTPIERVARGLHSVRSRETVFDNLSRTIKGHYFKEARAAIEALRDPSEKMVEAGIDLNDGFECSSSSVHWDAMISAALAEGDGK